MADVVHVRIIYFFRETFMLASSILRVSPHSGWAAVVAFTVTNAPAPPPGAESEMPVPVTVDAVPTLPATPVPLMLDTAGAPPTPGVIVRTVPEAIVASNST